jgi:hypothetical protein
MKTMNYLFLAFIFISNHLSAQKCDVDKYLSQKLLWSDVTKHNNEVCAIVKFESLFNPLKIDNIRMSVKGRSLYCGEMWISLKSKQFEYAVMAEDVIMKLKSTSFPEEQLVDLQPKLFSTK